MHEDSKESRSNIYINICATPTMLFSSIPPQSIAVASWAERGCDSLLNHKQNYWPAFSWIRPGSCIMSQRQITLGLINNSISTAQGWKEGNPTSPPNSASIRTNLTRDCSCKADKFVWSQITWQKHTCTSLLDRCVQTVGEQDKDAVLRLRSGWWDALVYVMLYGGRYVTFSGS